MHNFPTWCSGDTVPLPEVDEKWWVWRESDGGALRRDEMA